MADREALSLVLDHNRKVRRRAAELNRRAGTIHFPVMTEEELGRWIAGRLSGATSIASIADPETLRLPPLDPHVVAQIEMDNPLAIGVGSTVVSVDYGTDVPVVTLEYTSDALRALPADSLRLPGGRAVAVRIRFGTWGMSPGTTDLAQCRAQARTAARTAHWNRWSRPAVPVPDYGAAPHPLPAIREEVFGRDPFTGETFFAYGTITWNAANGFTAQWFDDFDAAEIARDIARDKLVEMHGPAWRDTAPRFRPTTVPAPAPPVPAPPARRSVPFTAPFVPSFRRTPAEGWVVTPEGTLRAHDRLDRLRPYEPEGTQQWNLVHADELALRWSRDGSGDHCEVVLRPADGITAAQLERVTAIETGLSLPPGSFGLGPADVNSSPRRRTSGWRLPWSGWLERRRRRS